VTSELGFLRDNDGNPPDFSYLRDDEEPEVEPFQEPACLSDLLSMLVGLNEASELTGVPVSTLRVYCQTGRLDASRIEGKWIIFKRSLDDLNARTVGRPSALQVAQEIPF